MRRFACLGAPFRFLCKMDLMQDASIDLSLWCYQTPPRDFFEEAVEEKLGHLKVEIDESMERAINPMKFVRQELSELTCSDHSETSRAEAAAEMCVCALLERMENLADQDWIPKSLFVECLAVYGYSEELALEKYEIYVRDKLREETSELHSVLWQAEENAINWSHEYRRKNPELSREAGRAKSEAYQARDDLRKYIDEETGRIMTESC